MSNDGRVAALGERVVISALALAGVQLCPAESPEAVRLAWGTLAGAGLVVLTPAAAETLSEDRLAPGAPLTVVMPS
jgi:vacuolar-type H+-ATPase subunit F/Vma7